jgi:sugar phosphate isomerase/epimerase
LTDAEFTVVRGKLENAGIRINCFGSGIANWGKNPRSAADFDASEKELVDALPRLAILGTTMIRGMSFAVAKDEKPDNPELEAIIFEKLNRLVKRCEDAGVLYLHENCMNYGGLSWRHTLKLVENVKSPAFKLVFDTGNPVFSEDWSIEPRGKRQSAWEFYDRVKDHVRYVHVKDALFRSNPETGKEELVYVYPGEGLGDVKRILADLLRRGYSGGISIEPHMGAVFHDPSVTTEAESRFSTWVEYGRRLERLLGEIA